MRVLSFLGVVSLLIIFGSTSANAQERQITISVTPAIIDISGNPGDKINSSFQIVNQGNFPLPISLEAQSLVLDSEDIINPEAAIRIDASSWFTFGTEKSLLFKPKQAKKIPLTVEVPQDASPGGHYAQISVRGLSLENPTTDNSTIVIPEISITVLITVSGDVENDVNFDNRNIFPAFVRPSSHRDVEIHIRNDGNIHDLITPVIKIYDDNELVGTQEIKSRLVLPNTTKVIKSTIETPPNGGIYQYVVEFKYDNGTEVSKKFETMFVGYSPFQILLIGFSVFFARYLYIKRKNVKTALNVLFGRTQ